MRRVLIVDDDPSIRDLISAALVDVGYQADEAEDGLEALQRADAWDYDLIFLDLLMPHMDGWAFLAAYAEVPGWHAPVVICSAVVDVDIRIKEVTVAGFLPKPFNIVDLYSCVCQCEDRIPKIGYAAPTGATTAVRPALSKWARGTALEPHLSLASKIEGARLLGRR